jgi:hypothetical protein
MFNISYYLFSKMLFNEHNTHTNIFTQIKGGCYGYAGVRIHNVGGCHKMAGGDNRFNVSTYNRKVISSETVSAESACADL